MDDSDSERISSSENELEDEDVSNFILFKGGKEKKVE